jgi:hypothetical protein
LQSIFAFYIWVHPYGISPVEHRATVSFCSLVPAEPSLRKGYFWLTLPSDGTVLATTNRIRGQIDYREQRPNSIPLSSGGAKQDVGRFDQPI